jgi:hypothetical protein
MVPEMPKAVFAKNAEAAFRALDQHEFKVIFLDHDLHWMHADNAIFKGPGKRWHASWRRRSSKGSSSFTPCMKKA